MIFSRTKDFLEQQGAEILETPFDIKRCCLGESVVLFIGGGWSTWENYSEHWEKRKRLGGRKGGVHNCLTEGLSGGRGKDAVSGLS